MIHCTDSNYNPSDSISIQEINLFTGRSASAKGWLAIAKLNPLSLFISLLLMLKKAFDNVRIEKRKVKVVSALQ